MEYSSLEEAFPNVETKKKSKKGKKLPLSYMEETADPDPDRQGCLRMPYVEAFQDISAHVSEPIRAAPTDLGIPKSVSAAMTTHKTQTSDYFGKGVDTEEGFANYSNVIGDDPTYRLTPDFAKQFLGVGLEKPAGVPPAQPNLDVAWKPLTDGVPTASFKVLPPGPGSSGYTADGPRGPKILGTNVPGGQLFGPGPGHRDEELHRKIDDLYRRIAELDRQKNSGSNAQTEILMFVSSGLALILLLHGLTAGGR